MKFLPPLVIILLVLLVALSFSRHHMGRKRVANECRKSVSRLETLLLRKVDEDTENLNGLTDLISSDTAIQQAYLSGDRGRLLAAATPIFDQICTPKSITHFYFHRLDKTCFLRVHSPDRFDDVIGRHTLRIAAETGQSSAGIELGPLGTLTLRRVYPWRVDKKLIGYIELGEDIRTIGQRLSEQLGIGIVVRIDKTFLNRDDWQEGAKMVDKTCGQWGDCDHHVTADSTLDEIPDQFKEYMHEHDTGLHTQWDHTLTWLDVSGRIYLAGHLPLTDVSGTVVGIWFTFGDVTASMAVVTRSVIVSIIITAIAGQCIYLFSFLFLERIEQRLEETDRRQRTEIANRRVAEAQLAEAKKRGDVAFADLQHTQEKIRLHVDLMPLGMIQWDPNLRVESWNPAAEEMFGYTAEEAVGRLAKDLIVPEEAQGRVEAIRQKLVSQAGGTNECNENRTKDGRRIMCQWHNTPLIDENGEVIGVSSVVQDVTKEVEYEHRLQEAKDRAEFANQAKSCFLANMSHELRTPMNAIIGFSDLLLEEALTDEQLDYIETIHVSSQHLLSLINDVLDLSKIEAGKEQITAAPCVLRPLLKQAESLIQTSIRDRGLQFELDISEDIPEQIVTDSKHLFQCLINLISNAIKFTEHGSVTLRVGVQNGGDFPVLRFDIQDTGIGISANCMAGIFEAFEQADVNTNIKYGGTGLGLAISKKLVEMMLGTLTVESEEGVGSTFTITLPFEAVPQPV